MKILHAADIHVCEKHHHWIDLALTSMVQQARATDIDAWVIAGDSFDSAISVHTPAYAMFVKHVMALADIAPGILLYGTMSHDRPGVLEAFKHMPTLYPIHVADEPQRIYLACAKGELGDMCEWIDDGSMDDDAESVGAVFCVMPSLNKADPEIMEHGARSIMQKWFDLWKEKNKISKAPTFLVTHGTVDGSVTESGYAMVSPDWEFSVETLKSAGTDYVLLGHIHAYQAWFDTQSGQAIAYPGSLARLVYGDLAKKGYLIWDTEIGIPPFKCMETPTRTLLEISFDGPPDMQELEELAAKANADTHVRIIWEADQMESHAVDKDAIRKMFEHAGELKLAGTTLKIQSVRSKGISKELTIDGKIRAYLATTGDESEMDALSARLGMLQSQDADRIVKVLLSPNHHPLNN